MISREARVEDMFKVDLQPIQAGRDPRKLLEEPKPGDPFYVYAARTIEKNGEVIAVFGITPTLPNSGEAWALLSKKALDLGSNLTHEVEFWLEKTQEEHQIRRVSATAAEDHPAAHRWLLRLGFEFEGIMRAYGLEGETHWLYGRIR